jgi:hypothetical protein
MAVRRHRSAVWMQTIGAALFTVKRCRPVRARTPAQDSHCAYVLLYLTAVRDDWREQQRCQGRVDIGLVPLTPPEALVSFLASGPLGCTRYSQEQGLRHGLVS